MKKLIIVLSFLTSYLCFSQQPASSAFEIATSQAKKALMARSSLVKPGAWGPSRTSRGTVGGEGRSILGRSGSEATSGSVTSGTGELFASDELFCVSGSVEALSQPQKNRTDSKTVVYLFFIISTC